MPKGARERQQIRRHNQSHPNVRTSDALRVHSVTSVFSTTQLDYHSSSIDLARSVGHHSPEIADRSDQIDEHAEH